MYFYTRDFVLLQILNFNIERVCVSVPFQGVKYLII